MKSQNHVTTQPKHIQKHTQTSVFTSNCLLYFSCDSLLSNNENIRYLTMQSIEPAHKFMALWKFLFLYFVACICLATTTAQQQKNNLKKVYIISYLAFFVD